MALFWRCRNMPFHLPIMTWHHIFQKAGITALRDKALEVLVVLATGKHVRVGVAHLAAPAAWGHTELTGFTLKQFGQHVAMVEHLCPHRALIIHTLRHSLFDHAHSAQSQNPR